MLAVQQYDIGDLIDLYGLFTDPDTGDVVEPDSVTCTVVNPAETTSTPSASPVSITVALAIKLDLLPADTELTGSITAYLAQTNPDQTGTWWYAFDGTGGVQASGERAFRVRTKHVPR